MLGSTPAAFAVNGVSFLASALVTLAIRGDLGPNVEAPEPEDAGASSSFRQQFLVGARALTSSRLVVAIVVVQLATSVLYGMEAVLYALASTDLLGMGVNGVAALYAAIGVGGVVFAGVAHRLSDRSQTGLVLAVATLLCGLPMMTIALIHDPQVALAVLLVEGAAMIVVDVLVVTSLQRMLGASVLGQAFGTLDSWIVAAILVGSVLAPAIAGAVSPQAALLAGGGITIVAGAGIPAGPFDR
jgi:predicted MFS family arabinose efflux permease